MSAPPIEQELKLALDDPAALGRLLEQLPTPQAIVEQQNHYYVDPEGRTADARLMVRLRLKQKRGGSAPTSARLTLKRKRSAEGGVFISEEIEDDIAWADWEQIRDGQLDLADVDVPAITDLRAELGLSSLRHEATMVNLRHEIAVEGGYLLEVDHTRFTEDDVEAEVECETSDPEGARRLIEAAASAAGVTLRPQGRSKYKRLLGYLAKRAG